MKTLAAIIAISLSAVFGQAQTTQSDRALQNYVHAVESPNPGVASSAMGNLMLYRIALPDKDYSEAKAALERVQQKKQENPVLAHKAYITMLFLQRPDTFNWLDLDTKQGRQTLSLLDEYLAYQIAAIKKQNVDSLFVSNR